MLWERHKPTELARSFSFCACVCFFLYGPLNCTSFHKFSRQLFPSSHCSCGLISALLVHSAIYLFMKVSFTPVPTGSLSRGGDVTIYVCDINQPSLPAPFYSVLVIISVFMAVSTVFHSINCPDNSPLFHSVLMVLFLPYWSFQLYISLRKSPSALRYSLLVDWAQNTSQLTNHSTTVPYSRLARLPSYPLSDSRIPKRP